MTCRKTSCIIILFLGSFLPGPRAAAQSLAQVQAMQQVPIQAGTSTGVVARVVNPHVSSSLPLTELQGKARLTGFAKDNTNEVQMLFSGLFLLYKFCFSSQDGASCGFTPSCSEYGILAVKKQGLILGVTSTFDRLSRCNGLSPEKYGFYPNTHLLHDPL